MSNTTLYGADSSTTPPIYYTELEAGIAAIVKENPPPSDFNISDVIKLRYYDNTKTDILNEVIP